MYLKKCSLIVKGQGVVDRVSLGRERPFDSEVATLLPQEPEQLPGPPKARILQGRASQKGGSWKALGFM